MKDGFIRVKTASPKIGVANVKKNTELVIAEIEKADKEKVNLLVLPELCLTGATCGDLFFSDLLLDEAKKGIIEIAKYTKDKYPVVVVGLPVVNSGKIYNCGAVVHNGEVLGFVPKTYPSNSGESAELRYFTPADKDSCGWIDLGELPTAQLSSELVFENREMNGFVLGVEVGSDISAPISPSTKLCLGGATVIANCGASAEYIGNEEYRKETVKATSARLNCGYIYANAGEGESTQDLVFAGHSVIAENGEIIAENKPFSSEASCTTEIDLKKLLSERRKNTAFKTNDYFCYIYFEQKPIDIELTREFDKNPFIPDKNDYARAERILTIQAKGLAKRLVASYSKTAVLGLSGGLDSTLAILVAIKAMDILGRPHSDVVAVTLPCFGTSSRTKSNAVVLAEALGVTLREINIGKAVMQHFEDIGHDPSVTNVTYENSQARERTQVLMDIANQVNGLVVGTGDMSELALGWATYNGDHMSMYGVNASVTKTLVRFVVNYVAQNSPEEIKKVLLDVIDTPVSPELLPTDDKGDMTQKTEDLVGPYELHDFFLYYTVRYGMTPEKIYRMAKHTFKGEYSDETIYKWLQTFTRRFFAMQFKRSCMPDGPKTGTVSLSPRGDWRMPSDAESAVWMGRIEEMK